MPTQEDFLIASCLMFVFGGMVGAFITLLIVFAFEDKNGKDTYNDPQG